MLWLLTPYLLLDGRVPWRRLVPQAGLCAVGVTILGVGCAIYVPRAMSSSAAEFGAIGVAFTLLSVLWAAGFVIVGAAAIGSLDWRPSSSPGEAPSLSRSAKLGAMTDVPPPPDPRDEPYYDPRRRDDRDGGGHGWQLVAVGLIALIIGGGAAYLIKDDGGDTTTEVRTVQRESPTVTVQAAPPATDAITVTQPPAETVVKTTTLTVTVPTTTETATEP